MLKGRRATFPPADGCAVCRAWNAISPQDAKGAGCRVVFTATRWRAFCGHCGRLTGRGPRLQDNGWNDQRKVAK